MKNLKIVAMVILTGVFMSCGSGSSKSESEQTPAEKLNGKWKIVNATGDWADLNIGTVYSFGEESAFSTKAGIIESKGKITKMDEKSFSVKFDELQNEFNYKYSFEGEKLIIEVTGSNQVFTLEKQ